MIKNDSPVVLFVFETCKGVNPHCCEPACVTAFSHVMSYSCTWCQPLEQLCSRHRSGGGPDASFEPHHYACYVFEPRADNTKRHRSLMETALIRSFKKKNLSNWASRSFVYSAFELRIAIKCFQKLPATNPIWTLLKQKQPNLHSFSECSLSHSATNIHSITSAGLLLQLHLAFTWSPPPLHIGEHTDNLTIDCKRREDVSRKSSTGRDRKRPTYRSRRPAEGTSLPVKPYTLKDDKLREDGGWGSRLNGSVGSLSCPDQSRLSVEVI